MNLSIDIGNSSIKLGVYSGNELVDFIKVYDINEAASFVGSYKVENTWVSSVRKETPKILAQLDSLDTIQRLTNDTSLPFELSYDTPKTLGIDRIAAALGAHYHYPDKDCLIIDLGTCNTMDILSASKGYLGGNIAPGWEMRLKAMDEMTSKLPLGNLKVHQEILGQSTLMAMENGAFYGLLFELEGYIKRLSEQFAGLITVFTGGAAIHFAEFIKTEIFVQPFLILDGLNHLNAFSK